MKLRAWLGNPRTRLDVVAGLVDGILNALTLAAGRLLKSPTPDVGLIVRVSIATGLTTLFVFFMAHYAELRAELVRAEKELNLLSHGRLASSRLGRQAMAAAAAGASLAAACGLVGSAAAFLICAYTPGPTWAGLVAAILVVGALGSLLARSFHGAPWFWAIAAMAGGAALTWVGVKIDLTG